MEYLNVILAAVGAYAFGAVWYMSVSKTWLKAAEIPCDANGKPLRSSGLAPFFVGFVAQLVVAGMMRHVFQMSGLNSMLEGIMGGAGIGAFLISPWVAMNYAFAGRKPSLAAIDGVNAVVGCTIMGVILNLF